MKKTLINLLIASTIVSCNVQYMPNYDNSSYSKTNKKLFHRYKSISTASSESEFNVKKRKVEFEYGILNQDSTIDLTISITTGFNEGEMKGVLSIMLEGNNTIKLNSIDLETKEYVETYNYSSSLPINKTKIINDPGGIDIVIQPDGTHKHVHRPASSKVVNVTEAQVENVQKSQSQIFNRAEFILSKTDLKMLSLYKIQTFEIKLKHETLKIHPNYFQQNQILYRLN